MPNAPTKWCNRPGCRKPSTVGAYCDDHQYRKSSFHDSRRKSSTQRGYGARWQRESKEYLKDNQICNGCGDWATVVDHVVAHKGDMVVFWDKTNWQPLCESCHNSKSGRGE